MTSNDSEDLALTLSIAAVERDTGLSKDTLRIWERRYGFPVPKRDATGERAYPLRQVQKLRLVKRLLDGGHRPGKVVPLPTDDLLKLCEGSPPTPTPSQDLPDVRLLLALLKQHDVYALRQQLTQVHMRLGLSRFLTDVVVPLNTLIGDSWMQGQLEIFEEHMYSEVLQSVLRSALSQLPRPEPEATPRVLLTTFPGEPHGLGLLMAEAVSHGRLKAYFIGLGILLTLAIGISRVYLGVHFPTDVLAGWALGGAWALVCWIVYSLTLSKTVSAGDSTEARS